MDDIVEKLISVRPSKRQLEWQKLEFTAFFHYGINSFTDREWGDGKEDISIFQPQKLDTDDWCEALILAGIKACIITAKHHDGFCLWDTSYTKYSVMNTPYGMDIVKQLSMSCEKYNIKLGVYLSPWDRHEESYGRGKEYDDYFCAQLEELLSKYGELYTVWFDGACGEGANGKKQIYDWERYYELIRRLQPSAVISVSGPDVRWCGNEAGDCRQSEWSVVPEELFSQSKIAKDSQTEDSLEFRRKLLDVQEQDLGSRNVIEGCESFIWYPAEVDTSIRPGWFYHESEDMKVRSFEELKDIYIKSVGGNSLLLLNIPPHKDGYITDYDKKTLKQIGDFIREEFSTNVIKKVILDGDCKSAVIPTDRLLIDDNQSIELLWCNQGENRIENQGETQGSYIEMILENKKNIQYLVIKEDISMSQRVEKYVVEVLNDMGAWINVYEGSTIGYKKICVLQGTLADRVRIRIIESRSNPIIQFVGIY